MNIHEFQGKSILQAHGVAVQEGFIAETPDQARMVAEELKKKYGTEIFVVKAQIHAGGRGKGGGVKIARSPEEAAEVASRMLVMMGPWAFSAKDAFGDAFLLKAGGPARNASTASFSVS